MRAFTSVMGDLEVALPPGWCRRPGDGDAVDLWARGDGGTGMLQLSKFSDDHFRYLADQEDLGSFAAALGERLGTKGQHWGKAAHSWGGACALGRFGLAAFRGGRYPSMLVCVTVSEQSAYLWTWLGPDPAAAEVEQALQVVVEARERPQTGQ